MDDNKKIKLLIMSLIYNLLNLQYYVLLFITVALIIFKHDTNKALLASLLSYAVHVIMALIKSKLMSSVEIYDFDDAFFETFEKKFGDIDEDDDDHDE